MYGTVKHITGRNAEESRTTISNTSHLSRNSKVLNPVILKFNDYSQN